ncbi:Dihydropyrimidinase [Citrus sinensis]|nr:Dihydropyrimidinase [Citrus sinensis]
MRQDYHEQVARLRCQLFVWNLDGVRRATGRPGSFGLCLDRLRRRGSGARSSRGWVRFVLCRRRRGSRVRQSGRGSGSCSIRLLATLPFVDTAGPTLYFFCDAGSEYGGLQCGIQSSSSSSAKILIKGGTVVNAHHQQIADVYVEDGIVVAVQPNINVGDDVKVLDATGKFVMPGGIDPHTHLAMEFMGSETIDDFFSGQAAALAGGTTMHIDFVIPINGSLTAGFEAYEKKAKNSCMDYGFHMAITKWDEIVSDEMEVMVKEKGINSFKFFMAYKGSFMINDELLIEGFKRCKSLGALAMVHAENGDAVFEGQKRMIELGITGPEGHALSRPPLLEGEATTRAIRLAEFVNTPLYVVHVMSMDAMEEIAKARKAGPNFLNITIPLCDSCRQRVIGEPVVSGLVLDDSWLWHSDFVTAAKQLVGTDHCAFNSTQKAFGIDDFRKIPNGVNGIEERMHLVWDTMVESGQISVTDYVRLTSTECARIFNVYPRKGAILVGSDADIIIFNPNSSFEITARSHHSRLDTNVYEGRRVKGKVEVTIAGGRVVWENDELNVVPGSGKYIEMRPFNYLFHGLDKADAKYLSSLQAPVKRLKSST